MSAVYKRELRAYLTSMTGYIFIAFIMFLVGIYFTAYNLTYGYSHFGYALSSSIFAFLIVVPILTMRLLAEEKRQKTDQILLTAPVKVMDIILGKYFAILTIFSIPVILFCFYPLLLSMFGTVSFSMTYTTILGYFLLGAAYLAVGMFISSLTESQVIAAVLSFGALLVSYMITGLSQFISGTAFTSFICFTILIIILAVIAYVMTKNYAFASGTAAVLEAMTIALYLFKSTLFEGAIAKILNVIDLATKFENFVNGIFDVTGIVYYLSIIVLFIFLSVQSLQKRRWS
ncbi:ABC-2 type transport system permease protein [Lachnotalea glycerini]|uniref:ABC transporter n=1 Tax=Lachnotalea glycerini TaxID=1763509 RepID=A0A255I3Q2_9FIRM|nr:ABC transporter permease [Lachnotalea glycerini]OYP43776.1 ABC transporter [Lachnotalea glycerini]PXV89056.1 ABC-2 type transport system permease protein [Lachnotalea glycerini]RDY31526.1 ABC transporter [Lachnotalea glycerini]